VSTTPTATSPSSATPDVSVIENEIPAYRAVSPVAIVSTLLGLASVLCFADLSFYFLPVLAIVTGAWAIRKIHRFSDVLTGVKFAQTGIVLALIFSISSATMNFVQTSLRARGADAFARKYIKTLNTRSLDDALWYKLPPTARRGVSPRDARESWEKQKAQPAPGEDSANPILVLHSKLKGPPERQLEFVEIEMHGVDRLTPIALAVAKLTGDPNSTAPGDGYVGVTLKALEGDVKPNAWYVDNVIFPYTPKSFVAKAPPIDDGHGHGH
jgi:hypothetical protein